MPQKMHMKWERECKRKMNFVKASEKPEVLNNLFSLYVYELSEKAPFFATMINENGQILPPPTMFDKETYVIYEEGKAIGFVNYEEGKEADYCIPELFISRAYQRKGLGTQIFEEYLKDKKGSFMVHILKSSDNAIAFFKKYCETHGLSYVESERDDIANNYFVTL